MRGKRHDDEIRAQVVGDLLAGMGVRDVARKRQLDPAIVSRIKSTIHEELQHVATEKRARIDEKILECVHVNLEAMASLAKIAHDTDYTKTQTARDLAELYKAMSNTALDILEAASNGGVEDESPDADDVAGV